MGKGKTGGQVAYETYGKHVHGMAQVLRVREAKWANLIPPVRAAWEAVAQSAIDNQCADPNTLKKFHALLAIAP